MVFEKKRVKQQELNKRFKEWKENTKEKREKLSKSLKEANERKREELKKYIESLEIKIERISLEELKEQSIEHYNELWCSRGRFDKYANEKSDENFLKRICVNMLRHEFTDYEYEIYKMFGKVGKEQGYEMLKNRINEEIYKTYPELKP